MRRFIMEHKEIQKPVRRRLKKIGIKDLGDNSLGSPRSFEVPPKFISWECVLYLKLFAIPGVKFVVPVHTSKGIILNFYLKEGVLYESICLDIVKALESFNKLEKNLDSQEFAEEKKNFGEENCKILFLPKAIDSLSDDGIAMIKESPNWVPGIVKLLIGKEPKTVLVVKEPDVEWDRILSGLEVIFYEICNPIAWEDILFPKDRPNQMWIPCSGPVKKETIEQLLNMDESYNVFVSGNYIVVVKYSFLDWTEDCKRNAFEIVQHMQQDVGNRSWKFVLGEILDSQDFVEERESFGEENCRVLLLPPVLQSMDSHGMAFFRATLCCFVPGVVEVSLGQDNMMLLIVKSPESEWGAIQGILEEKFTDLLQKINSNG